MHVFCERVMSLHHSDLGHLQTSKANMSALLYTQIKALGQGGEWRRALAAFDEMRGLQLRGTSNSPRPPSPNVRTWGLVIAGCHACAQWRRVLDLYSDMRAAGLEPDGAVLQTVIFACEKVGAWEEADAVRLPLWLSLYHCLCCALRMHPQQHFCCRHAQSILLAVCLPGDVERNGGRHSV